MTTEAEQRELRLRDDMEKLRTQQEQTLGTLDTKIDAMMERRTQAIMDKLDGLLGSRSEPREVEVEPNLGGPSREPRGTLMTNKGGGHMHPLEVGAAQQAMPQGIREHGDQISEEVQLAKDRPRTNDRRKAHMRL